MQTVGWIQFQLSLTGVFIDFNFIDITRAKPGTRTAVGRIAGVYTKFGVVHNYMGRLIFPMFGLGQIDTGQLVHIQVAVINFRIHTGLNVKSLAVKGLE